MFDVNNPYCKMPKDKFGWIDATKYFPPEYELVKIRTNLRDIQGWWTGFEWYIRKKLDNERIISWRRILSIYKNY